MEVLLNTKKTHTGTNNYASVEGCDCLVNQQDLLDFNATYNADTYSSIVKAFTGENGVNWIHC